MAPRPKFKLDCFPFAFFAALREKKWRRGMKFKLDSFPIAFFAPLREKYGAKA
jgi:hypothetical protein